MESLIDAGGVVVVEATQSFEFLVNQEPLLTDSAAVFQQVISYTMGRNALS